MLYIRTCSMDAYIAMYFPIKLYFKVIDRWFACMVCTNVLHRYFALRSGLIFKESFSSVRLGLVFKLVHLSKFLLFQQVESLPVGSLETLFQANLLSPLISSPLPPPLSPFSSLITPSLQLLASRKPSDMQLLTLSSCLLLWIGTACEQEGSNNNTHTSLAMDIPAQSNKATHKIHTSAISLYIVRITKITKLSIRSLFLLYIYMCLCQ